MVCAEPGGVLGLGAGEFCARGIRERYAGGCRERNAARCAALRSRAQIFADTRQHGAVEASDALRAIEKYSGLKAAELTAIRRQDSDLLFFVRLFEVQPNSLLPELDPDEHLGTAVRKLLARGQRRRRRLSTPQTKVK